MNTKIITLLRIVMNIILLSTHHKVRQSSQESAYSVQS